MAGPFDRYRAAGQYKYSVVPRHEPDPRDLSQEFVDEQWTPPLSDPAEFAARGGGQALSVGGGQQMYAAPTTPVTGSQPAQPSVDQIAGVGSNRLAALSRSTPRGQQMMAQNDSFRRQMASLEQTNKRIEQAALEYEKSNPGLGSIFTAALQRYLGVPAQVGQSQQVAQAAPPPPPASAFGRYR